MVEDKFMKELEELINKHSKENESNTPDFILASYIHHALQAFDIAVENRDSWYGFKPLESKLEGESATSHTSQDTNK